MFGGGKKGKKKTANDFFAVSERQSVTSVMYIAQWKQAHLLVQGILRTAQS